MDFFLCKYFFNFPMGKSEMKHFTLIWFNPGYKIHGSCGSQAFCHIFPSGLNSMILHDALYGLVKWKTVMHHGKCSSTSEWRDGTWQDGTFAIMARWWQKTLCLQFLRGTAAP